MLGNSEIVIESRKIRLGCGIGSPTIGSLLQEEENEVAQLVQQRCEATDQLVFVKCSPDVFIVI